MPGISLEPSALDRAIQERVDALLLQKGFSDDARKAFKRTADLDEKFHLALRVLRNNGFLDSKDASNFKDSKSRDEARLSYIELVDTMSTPDATLLMPKVLVQVVKEAIEPQLNLTPLLRKLRYTAGTTMTFPAMSAMSGVADLTEGDEYPELMGPRFAGTVTAKVGKVGCAVRITEEMLRYSQWDIMSMLIQGAGKAMARHKEVKISSLIQDNAVVSFDNSGGTSTNGKTTGRAITGHFNNTIRLDDLFVTYSDLLNDGFLPNIMLVNAAGWLVFARDPTMRAFNFAHGGPLMNTAQGSNVQPFGGEQWPVASAADLRNTATTFSPVPGLFPVPLQVIVSPYINYDSSAKTTSMIIADRDELGMMVVDEDVMTDQFDDVMRDIRRIKFRERYGFAVLNDGDAIRSILGVSTARGFDFEDTKTMWDIADAPLPTI